MTPPPPTRHHPPLDIEDADALQAYLIHIERVAADEPLEIHVLAGGVSNKTVRVTRPTGEAWVVKQALPKLRVQADWFADPDRIRHEAEGMRQLGRLIPGHVPTLCFEDADHHLLAMTAVPEPHEVWKQTLMHGRAIGDAGLTSGSDAYLAMDVAASHFYRDGNYVLDGEPRSSTQMIETLGRWAEAYPLVSIEDGLAEDDWAHWPSLCAALGDRALVLGDDLLCTNPQRIKRAAERGACNALLLKVNQVGTLTEAAESYRLAREAGWMVTLSVRSGETEDDWAADLAVGWSADQFKNGSITQSERLAKYNRLLAIEQETSLPLVPGFRPTR